MMKEIKVTVKVSWELKEGILYQTLSFKENKYISNPSFLIHEKFEDAIVQKTSNNPNVKFFDMCREDGKIIIKYKLLSDIDMNDFKPFFYTISSTIPDFEGCRFCKYFNKRKSICTFQDKDIYNLRTKCRFFKQRKIIKT